MKCADEFRDPAISQGLLKEIRRHLSKPIRIMEVCGTHTTSIFRHGIRSLLPEEITLLSGPGCPVCVTPAGQIESFIAASHLPDTILATFGDLIRVPGSSSSLATARSQGAQVEIVYSPMDALNLARENPAKNTIFPAVGFETTTPTIAATILQANALKFDNFFIISAAKTMPEALDLLLSDPDLQVDALLCPGHVSAITGIEFYKPLVEKYGLCCAVAGFEPADILAGILSLIQQFQKEAPEVANCYPRAVTTAGNLRARQLVDQVFTQADSEWRGLGVIQGSGLKLKERYVSFDAINHFAIPTTHAEEPRGCRCGDVLKGRFTPPQCLLYGKKCTPMQPVGPCMVSHEGSCAAYYRYSS